MCGAGGQQVTFSFVAGTAVTPILVDVPADGDCVDVTTPPTSMPLGSVQITAAVTDVCNRSASATTASTGANEARIMSPENGSQVNASQDRDPVRRGCQVVVEAIADGIAEGLNWLYVRAFNRVPSLPYAMVERLPMTSHAQS